MDVERTHFCPACRRPLERRPAASGSHLECGSCHGVLINLAVLRQSIDDRVVTALWQRVRASALVPARQCPTCPKLLRPFTTTVGDSDVELDGCLLCQALWFDGAELDQLKAVSGRVAKPRPRSQRSGYQPSGVAVPSYGYVTDAFDAVSFVADVFFDFSA